MPPRMVSTPEEARSLLVELGAPPRLVTHGFLVLEAADALLSAVAAMAVKVDEPLVRAGAMLHDVGKIAFTAELASPGNEHETAGQALLLERGIDPRVARHCVAHARWATMSPSLEELLVALADALWKGVRRQALEERVVDEIARHLGADRWEIFVSLDSTFEAIAEGGGERLARSSTSGA
ncbi:MAG: HDIG domain-containing protein [Deltaproteobacteria bacterium]|nr:HDIG domain-containing protein [Deltaproteobacteria bacterium]